MPRMWLLVGFWSALGALVLASTLSGCAGGQRERQQDFARGKLLYQKHCQNCHKEDGQGYEQLYPPLNQVDYMQENPEKVACILRYGMNGPVTIKGQEYNLYMPGNQQLSDHRLAQLMTYIYNDWGNEHPRFTADFISKSLSGCDTTVITNR